MGINNKPLLWLEAWLGQGMVMDNKGRKQKNERSQYVQIGNEKSEICQITSGCIQGSVICPFAFHIYVNDLLTNLNNYGQTLLPLMYAVNFITIAVQRRQKNTSTRYNGGKGYACHTESKTYNWQMFL